MAKIKFERKGAFASAVETENEKAQEALDVVTEKTSNGETLLIRLDVIENPTKHDRVGYSPIAIKELSQSLKELGQLQPIVVRLLPSGKYERIIGFRRILAAKMAGWTDINAVVLENIEDDVAALMMLSENIHREDPNVYDQTVKLIEFISLSIGMNEEELVKLLYRFRNFDSNKIDDLSEEEKDAREKVNIVLERTAKISLTTMVDRLRVLSLSSKLINAMREKGLSYTNAVELNKIKEEEIMESLLVRAILEKPSKNEVKSWIKAIKSDDKQPKEMSKILNAIQSLSKALTVKKIQKIPKDNAEEIIKLLQKVENLL